MLKLSALLQVNHAMLRMHCTAGDAALDTASGNGGDTILLAGLVGPEGLVIGLDRRDEGLAHTADLLNVMDLGSRVRLLRHEYGDIPEILTGVLRTNRQTNGLAAAVFHPDPPPNGGRRAETGAESLLKAMDAVWNHIRPGGLLSAYALTGNTGGEEDAAAVRTWMQRLPWKEAEVTVCSPHNRAGGEVLFLAVKTVQS